MKSSIIKKYKVLSLLSGLAMGIIFPFFSLLFVSGFKGNNSFLFFTLACIAAGLTVGLLSYLIGNMTIIKQIKIVSDGLYTIAESDGDLTRRVVINSEDVIGDLGKNFNRFIEKVQNVIRIIIDHVGQVTVSARHITTYAQKISHETVSVSGSVSKMTTLTVQSNENVVMISEATEMISKSVSHISNSIQKFNESIEDVLTTCRKEIEIVAQADSQMKSGESVMKQLGGSAESISSIVHFINEIASNIDLLALNAAIEAARVGSMGKGFAVVADEIKRLAGRTSQATHDIAGHVHQIQDIAKSAIQLMDEISRLFVDVNSLSHEIVRAVEIQNATSEEIADQIHQVSGSVDSVTENVVDTSRTLDVANTTMVEVNRVLTSTNTNVKEMESSAGNLLRSSETLRMEAGKFKVL